MLDASAVIEFLASAVPDKALVRRIMTGQAAAPELVDLEVMSALHKQVRRGQLAPDAAHAAVDDLRQFPIARSPHRVLLRRVWEMRHAITTYDDSYVALAEKLRVPVVTTDAKLAESNGHQAETERYPAS